MSGTSAKAEWNILRMLEWGTDYLAEKHINTPRLSMEWILSHVLECKRLDLYMMYDRPLSREQLDLIKPLILRRARHEPLQYITGSTDFYGYSINVNPSVLIPRPETEQLVEVILTDFPDKSTSLSVLDIGTGSGCIPIALKKERPNWMVSAVDISEDALRTARKNARRCEVDISFFKHDFFDSEIAGQNEAPFDIIVSNPPYIPEAERETIDTEVKAFEPSVALFHQNIENVYLAIEQLALKNLKAGGCLYLEIHEEFGDKILSFLAPNRWEITLQKDYSDRDRMIKATLILLS